MYPFLKYLKMRIGFRLLEPSSILATHSCTPIRSETQKLIGLVSRMPQKASHKRDLIATDISINRRNTTHKANIPNANVSRPKFPEIPKKKRNESWTSVASGSHFYLLPHHYNMVIIAQKESHVNTSIMISNAAKSNVTWISHLLFIIHLKSPKINRESFRFSLYCTKNDRFLLHRAIQVHQQYNR